MADNGRGLCPAVNHDIPAVNFLTQNVEIGNMAEYLKLFAVESHRV